MRGNAAAHRAFVAQRPVAPQHVAHGDTGGLGRGGDRIALLAILFVMLYVGMNNTHQIDFHFPVAGTTTKTPVHASAALVYFGMFAIGLLAGTILAYGGGSSEGGKKTGAKGK